MTDADDVPKDWLRTRTANIIRTSPLPDAAKSDFLTDVQTGEFAIAVEFLCSRLYEDDYQISKEYFQVLSALYEDLHVPGRHLELVAEYCLLKE